MSPGHDQHGFGVRLEWGQAGVQILAADADLVVTVDVLAFSTAVSVVVGRVPLLTDGAFQGSVNLPGDGARGG